MTKTKTEEFHISGAKLIEQIKDLLREGNVRHVSIQDDDGDFKLEMPLTVGVLAGGALTLLAPWLAILGVVAGLVASVKVVVEREVEDAPGGDAAADQAAADADEPVV